MAEPIVDPVDEPAKMHYVAVSIYQKDGSDPQYTFYNTNPEDTIDLFCVSDVIGVIISVDEFGEITYGDDYKKRLSRVIDRKTREEDVES